MTILLDTNSEKYARRERMVFGRDDVSVGHLITPLTSYTNRAKSGELFAYDNAAFGVPDLAGFKRILRRDEQFQSRCSFVTVPDAPCCARRTMELWNLFADQAWLKEWPLAFVAQNGIGQVDVSERMWGRIAAVFIGGDDSFKDNVLGEGFAFARAAKWRGKHIHVGRVNGKPRFDIWKKLADSCDGSGISQYDDQFARMIGVADPSEGLFTETDAA